MNIPFQFSNNAWEEIKRLRAQQQETSLFLRVGVKGGGCSGLTYVLEWTKEKEDNEKIIDKDTVSIIFKDAHLLYLKNMQIDFQKGLNARGFVFENPNASATCGCGTSFSV